MKPISLFTIGYEDKSVDEFLAKLKKHRIKILVDIRERPISRRPGFSKNKINDHLQSIGVKYIHMSELGSPNELREKLHSDNDYDSFFKEYQKHLNKLSNVTKKLYNEIVVQDLTCVMCMERDPLQCHRLIVAKKIKEIDGNGMVITHI